MDQPNTNKMAPKLRIVVQAHEDKARINKLYKPKRVQQRSNCLKGIGHIHWKMNVAELRAFTVGSTNI
jgi:hypothetical protein